MAKRPFCPFTKHDWVPKTRGKGMRCAHCPDVFPCSYECAHFDCQEERGRDSRCAVCRKPVPFDVQFRIGSKRFYVVHRACRARFRDGSSESDSLQSEQEDSDDAAHGSEHEHGTRDLAA